MWITRQSPLTGKYTTLDVPVTHEQIIELQSWPRRCVQDIMPNVPAPLREFVLTGHTPEDWEALFGERDE